MGGAMGGTRRGVAQEGRGGGEGLGTWRGRGAVAGRRHVPRKSVGLARQHRAESGLGSLWAAGTWAAGARAAGR